MARHVSLFPLIPKIKGGGCRCCAARWHDLQIKATSPDNNYFLHQLLFFDHRIYILNA